MVDSTLSAWLIKPFECLVDSAEMEAKQQGGGKQLLLGDWSRQSPRGQAMQCKDPMLYHYSQARNPRKGIALRISFALLGRCGSARSMWGLGAKWRTCRPHSWRTTAPSRCPYPITRRLLARSEAVVARAAADTCHHQSSLIPAIISHH